MHKRDESIKSITDFMQTFNTENKCIRYLVRLKWGTSWCCSQCGNKTYYYISTRKLMRCKQCSHDESLISNSVMKRTRKPLTQWFWTIYTIVTQRTGISAMELYRQLDFGSYKTAWTWLQKIRLAMTEMERNQLQDEVEVDETYLFTKQAGVGRSLLDDTKALVICAVEVKNGRKITSGQVRLRAIDAASQEEINSFILDHVERRSIIRTDGWPGYGGLGNLGYDHRPKVLESPKDASIEFPRVHRVFANLKGWLVGTHRFVSRKHLQNYLNEFSMRVNARYGPIEVFNEILKTVVLTQPRTLREFTEPEYPIYPNPSL